MVYEGRKKRRNNLKHNKQKNKDAKTWKDLEKNIPNSRLECKIHTLLETKMAKIDSLFPQLYSQALLWLKLVKRPSERGCYFLPKIFICINGA